MQPQTGNNQNLFNALYKIYDIPALNSEMEEITDAIMKDIELEQSSLGKDVLEYYAIQHQTRILQGLINYFEFFGQEYQKDYLKSRNEFDRGNARAYELVVRKLEEELLKLKQK